MCTFATFSYRRPVKKENQEWESVYKKAFARRFMLDCLNLAISN